MQIVYRVSAYRAFGLTILGSFSVLFAAQAVNGFAFGWVMASLAALLAFRSAMLKIALRDGVLRVHSWLRNSCIPLSSVHRFDVLPYSGFWLKGGSISWIETLTFTDASGADHRIPPIVGLLGHAPTRIARELNLRLAAAHGSDH